MQSRRINFNFDFGDRSRFILPFYSTSTLISVLNFCCHTPTYLFLWIRNIQGHYKETLHCCNQRFASEVSPEEIRGSKTQDFFVILALRKKFLLWGAVRTNLMQFGCFHLHKSQLRVFFFFFVASPLKEYLWRSVFLMVRGSKYIFIKSQFCIIFSILVLSLPAPLLRILVKVDGCRIMAWVNFQNSFTFLFIHF